LPNSSGSISWLANDAQPLLLLVREHASAVSEFGLHEVLCVVMWCDAVHLVGQFLQVGLVLHDFLVLCVFGRFLGAVLLELHKFCMWVWFDRALFYGELGSLFASNFLVHFWFCFFVVGSLGQISFWCFGLYDYSSGDVKYLCCWVVLVSVVINFVCFVNFISGSYYVCENSIVRLNGKNYASWEFQFRMFVKGKELRDHLVGSSPAPTDPKELSSWEVKDAKIASWLLSSVEPHMVNNLRGFTIAKAMWDYLRRIYFQDNSARKFQLELDIGNYRQGNLSIEQFYSGFINLWNDYSGLVHSQVPKEALAALQVVHSESQRDQFLMKLRPKFESVRAALIHRQLVPSLEVCLGELLREEQHLASQLGLTQDACGSEMVNMAYAAQDRGRSRALPQCYRCWEIGPLAKHCSKKFCIIVGRRVIFLGIVVHALRITPLLLSILLFNPLLCLHLPHSLLFRVLPPTLLPSRFNR